MVDLRKRKPPEAENSKDTLHGYKFVQSEFSKPRNEMAPDVPSYSYSPEARVWDLSHDVRTCSTIRSSQDSPVNIEVVSQYTQKNKVCQPMVVFNV